MLSEFRFRSRVSVPCVLTAPIFSRNVLVFLTLSSFHYSLSRIEFTSTCTLS